MSTTWVLVAERGGATIYEHHRAGGGLTVRKTISHPEGRLESHEIGTDRPGRTYEGQGGSQSAFEPKHTPTETVTEAFAAKLADTLHEARNQHEFDRLVLVAEPRFLGRLRSVLDRITTASVVGSVDKDLAHASTKDLEHHLEHLLNVT